MAFAEQRNTEATCYVGGLDDKVTEVLLYELFVQCGPISNVFMPKDRLTNKHQGYGFVEFAIDRDAEYASKVMNMVKLYGKPIKVNKANVNSKIQEVGANLFIGNLDENVDEKMLHDTFSAFGGMIDQPKIMRDPETGVSKGYAFLFYDSFEASDLAIQCMNGQYLANKPISVQYALKKDSTTERHGSQAERLLAGEMRKQNVGFQPHTRFAADNDAATIAPQYGYGQMQQPQVPVQSYGYAMPQNYPGMVPSQAVPLVYGQQQYFPTQQIPQPYSIQPPSSFPPMPMQQQSVTYPVPPNLPRS